MGLDPDTPKDDHYRYMVWFVMYSSNFNNSQPRRFDKRDIISHSCSGRGHISRFCRNKGNNSASYRSGSQNKGESDRSSKQENTNKSAVSSGSRFSKKGAMYSAVLTQASSKSEDDSSWYVDSASTQHMSYLTPERVSSIKQIVIGTAGTETLKCDKIGNFNVNLTTGKKCITDVHIVKDLSLNLVSVPKLTENGFKTVCSQFV